MAGNIYKSLERSQYWQGQALLSRDFNAQFDSAEQLRWWHNRAVHGAPLQGSFGVGFGLAVSAGDKGAFTLACGMAYDCFGRELVVPTPFAVAAPPADARKPIFLALAWNGTRGEVSWVPQDELGPNQGVLLARVKDDGSLDTDFHAWKSRPLARLRLAGGATPQGSTPWEKLLGAQGQPIGLRTRIDTSAAGFTKVPFYVISLCWPKGNTRFSEPLATIADANPDSFTVRLLLQGIGQEAFGVISDIVTLSQAQWANKQVDGFLANDVLARVLPRAKTAIRIDAVTPASNTLTLAAGSAFKKDDFVALLSPPRILRADPVGAQAVLLDHPELFPANTPVLRRGGTVAGSAAAIGSVVDGLLIPKSSIAGLQKNDHLAVLQPVVKVVSAAGDKVIVETLPDFTGIDTLVRLSAAIENEVPVRVIGTDGPTKTITISVAIPGLARDEELGAPDPANTDTVKDLFSNVLTTPAPDQFRAGDVLFHNTRFGIVKRRRGALLELGSPLDVSAGDEVAIGGYGPSSTITSSPANPASIGVANPALFRVGDEVALRKGAADGTAATARVTAVGAAITIAPGFLQAAAGDVVSVLRFAARAQVNGLPLKVDDPTRFRAGDLVTNDLAALVNVAEVGEVHADGTVVLKRGADLHATAGQTLSALFVETVPTAGADAAGTSLVLNLAAGARTGSYAAPVDRWIDASSPAKWNALPDGALPGDSIGHAGFSRDQKSLRFRTDAKLSPGLFLLVEGPDENTGNEQRFFAFVDSVDAQNRASISGGGSGVIRPEQLSIVSGFSPNLTDDFVAYAQNQGLSICWMGCQIPSEPPATCPGLPAEASCSCH